MKRIDSLIRRILLCIVLFYQRYISIFLPKCCRFVPSCSNYAAEVLQRKPLLPGLWLIVRRIVKCHPLHRAGIDPVP